MKQNKVLISLVVIIVILTGLYFLVDSGIFEPKKEPPPAVKTENLTVTNYSAPADHMEIINEHGTMTFDYGADGWVLKEHPLYPMSDTILNSLAAAVCRLTAVRELDYSEESLKLFGLDTPAVTVTFTSSNASGKLLIGARNTATGDYYIMLEGRRRIYTLGGSYAELFTGSSFDYLLIPEFPDISASMVSKFEIVHKEKSVSFNKMSDSNGTHKNFITAYNSLYVSQCLDPYTENLEKYGLTDDKDYIRISYTSADSQSSELNLTIGDTFPEDERYYYVTLSDHPNTVYLMFNMNLDRIWNYME